MLLFLCLLWEKKLTEALIIEWDFQFLYFKNMFAVGFRVGESVITLI